MEEALPDGRVTYMETSAQMSRFVVGKRGQLLH
jgi:hypothetical protein